MVREFVAQRLHYLRRRGTLHKDQVPGGAVKPVVGRLRFVAISLGVVVRDCQALLGGKGDQGSVGVLAIVAGQYWGLQRGDRVSLGLADVENRNTAEGE